MSLQVYALKKAPPLTGDVVLGCDVSSPPLSTLDSGSESWRAAQTSGLRSYLPLLEGASI